MTRRAFDLAPIWRLLPWAVLLAAILLRLHALGRLPGINGDEAWYGVKAQRWVSGETVHWRTPTGNLPGPLQLGWLLLLQAVFKPSFLLLRIPSLISSLGAIAIAYAIGRRFFDRTVAVIAMMLMAALPANIAYARLGWDPSHLGFVLLGATYAALAGSRLLSTFLFALALTVHPTAVFAAPLLVLVLFGEAMERTDGRQALLEAAAHVALLVAALTILLVTTSRGQAGIGLSELPYRIANPREWAAFLILVGRMLSGATVYSYITGEGFGTWTKAADIAGFILLGFIIVMGVRGLRHRRFDREAGVITGWLASLLAFFLIAGNGALQPHFERYAIWLIPPTVLAIALVSRRLGRDGRRATALIATLAILLLAGFWCRYFLVLERQGSSSAQTFWSGAHEPKRQALKQIIAAAQTEGPARVVTEDWWLYWPVAYLASGHRLDIIDAERGLPEAPHAGDWPGGTYWLVFAGSKLDRQVATMPGMRLRWTIVATGHPQALHIWWSPALRLPTAPPLPAPR